MKTLMRHKQLIGYISLMVMLMLCNTHLITGETASWSVFRFNDVMQGQWWRVLTHPFTHVSLYHFFIDTSATFILLSQLGSSSIAGRLLPFVLSSAVSLSAVVLFSPHLLSTGYCGLSGTAHGLMSFLGLQWMQGTKTGKGIDTISGITGILLLISSAGKSLIEVMAGDVLFANLHLGELGIPLVHAHLGGSIGGILSFYLLGKRKQLFFKTNAVNHQSQYISSPSGDPGL